MIRDAGAMARRRQGSSKDKDYAAWIAIARRLARKMKIEQKSSMVTKFVRGALVRKKFNRTRSGVIKVQASARLRFDTGRHVKVFRLFK